jgi:putative flippase GtrA
MTQFILQSIKDKTFVRFLLVGLLNTLFGYSIFAVLIYFGFHYTIATLLSTVLGVLFNFRTIGTLVFKNSRGHLIVKFIAVYAIIYCLNIAFLKILNMWSFNMYIAGLVLLFPMAVTAYFLNKHFVFRERTIGYSIR